VQVNDELYLNISRGHNSGRGTTNLKLNKLQY